MFKDCPKIKILDLSNFNTSNVTDFGDMFSGLKALTSIDLSSFDTRKGNKSIRSSGRCRRHGRGGYV